MGDYFALLGEPRRPWLDPDALKQKFLTLSATVHPDRIHGASADEKETANRQFAELNTAFNCLREPKDRLRHLLELESGAKPKDLQDMPPDLADLFMEIAQLRNDAGRFLAERAKAESPILRVQFFERAQEWIERLSAVQRRLNERQTAITTSLQGLDQDWQKSDPAQRGQLLRRLEEIYRLLSFHSRWSLQLQEVIVQLTL